MPENSRHPEKDDKKRPEADVDQTVEQSFPASDPPSWTPQESEKDKPGKS